VRTIGAILPADLLAAVVGGTDLAGMTAADYHLELGVSPREAANRAWAVLTGAWGAYRAALASGPAGDPAVGLTRDRWLGVVLRELGFGRVPTTPAGGLIADERSWPVSHLADGCVPVHLLGAGVALDTRTPGMPGAAERPPHAMVQDLLNRCEAYLWAIVANGSTLRLLRDSSTLVGPSFVEFDLAAIFDGELFSDFVVLYLLAHQSRFEPTDAEIGVTSCWLERWRDHAAAVGARALGALRVGVHDAIEALGTGLLAHPANTALRASLDDGPLSLADYQHALLRLVYRLLFCFVAEDRGLLADPDAGPVARARYERWYSTARLRRIALRRNGDNHADLWQALALVLDSLGKEGGCAALGLPGLGGIFELGRADLDAGLALNNRALLAAIRHLCVTRPDPGGPRRVVDYRNLGAEELGGIYESLLEYVPRHNRTTRAFTLELIAGNDRKKSGAYYTPSSLTACLLDTALDPLLDRAERAPDPAGALLGLTVCDPACGSGHFLVAAARRIANRLAVVRAAGAEPSLDQIQAAMHDVVAHCLYGVDVNPLAAELAKVSLWLEGLQAGAPLGMLDAHIKVGNALLGTTPALLADGIPDGAFSPIKGDDKKFASSLKNRNKAERAGQGRFAAESTITVATGALAERSAAIDNLAARSLADIHVAERRLRELEHSPEARHAQLVCDAWCAAFVLPKMRGGAELTQADLVTLAAGGPGADAALIDAVAEAAARYRFFHWHLEFAQIFEGAGGFDCVIGNPPWEHVELKEQEWFAARLPAIAEASGDTRKRLIHDLTEERPALAAEYRAALRQVDAERSFYGKSGRYPLCGRGRINTYAVFAEADRALLAGTGQLGVILPTGIATDATTQYFFKDLVTSRSLVSLYDFENHDRIFEAVDSRVKFCLLTLTGRDAAAGVASFAFFAHQPDDLQREGVRFALTPEEITLLNPNTGTCPVFRTRRDAEITLGIYRRHPVLIRKGAAGGNPWGVSFMQGLFNMTSDSDLFHTRAELETDGWALDGNVFRRGADAMLPLYEAKMVHHYDHRWATYTGAGDVRDVTEAEHADPYFTVLPRYWVESRDVHGRLAGRWKHDWLLGFRNICRSTDERTFISGSMPRVAVGHSMPLLMAGTLPHMLAAAICSICFDYQARQKVGGTNMTFNYVEQFTVPLPDTFAERCAWSSGVTIQDWMEDRIDELAYTAWDMAPAALSLGDDGAPFVWDPARRAVLRAELDGAFFHLYGIERDDVEYILGTFPILIRKDPGLVDRVLDAYDGMATAMQTGTSFVSALDPPPGEGRRHQATS
jgi:hypothetical protein